jgi:hypothetical protein
MFIYVQGEHIIKEISERTPIYVTSYAAPLVAGYLALLNLNFPTFGMVALKNIVLDTADPFPEYIGGYDSVEIPNKERRNRFNNSFRISL